MNEKQAKKLRQLERRRMAKTMAVWFDQPLKMRLWIAWKLIWRK
jgi:hypothetical protein